MTPASLFQILNLAPLTKVQVLTRATLNDASISLPPGRPPAPLPFWYVQGQNNGMLELMSPGGYKCNVTPQDVCDVLASEPVEVMAMPRHIFIERSSLTAKERHETHGPHLFEPAFVASVTKDKWGRIDQVFVRFKDPQFNIGASSCASAVDDASQKLLSEIATRHRMPIVKWGDRSASWSAAPNERPGDGTARRRVLSFFKSRLSETEEASPMPTDVLRQRQRG
jgi:hypothetical protein